MSSIKQLFFILLINTLYGYDPAFPVDGDFLPPKLDAPYPLYDDTDYDLTWTTDYTSKEADALGSIASSWDGKYRTVNDNYNINVVSTVKSWHSLPAALDNAVFTVKYMTDSIQSPAVLQQLQNHNVYIYHCDPDMNTGLGLQEKMGKYDYVSDLLEYEADTFDGRAVDQVYGYGGNRVSPTTTCDCNVLGTACTSNAHRSSSILLHELGHTIMDVGIKNGLPSIYAALTGSIFAKYRTISGAVNSYCGGMAQEMWACAVQVWFSGTLRNENNLNPGISSIDEILTNVPELYNALSQVFGKSLIEIVPKLSNVNGLTSTAWTFYDYYINTYRLDTIKVRWNSMKHIGTPQTSTGVTVRNPVPTPRPTPTTTSRKIGCGQSVSGTITSGGKAYYSFIYNGGNILMYGCGRTYFSNKMKIIDYFWNEKGSDTASAYTECSSNTLYNDQTVWADSSYFTEGSMYWLVIEGQTVNDYGTYGLTMYCYDAKEDTFILPDGGNANNNISSWSINPWSILIIIVLILLVVNVFLVYFLVRYITNKKMKEFEQKQTKLTYHQNVNKMMALDKSDDGQETIEVDVDIEIFKSITTR